MAFQKGHVKYGGRKQGTTNRYVTVSQALSSLNYDPIKHFVELMQKPQTTEIIDGKTIFHGISDEIKAEKILELLKFIHPTLQAAQLTIDNISEELQNKKLDAMHAE